MWVVGFFMEYKNKEKQEILLQLVQGEGGEQGPAALGSAITQGCCRYSSRVQHLSRFVGITSSPGND